MGVLGYITDFLKTLPAKTLFNKCSKKNLKNSNLSISYIRNVCILNTVVEAFKKINDFLT